MELIALITIFFVVFLIVLAFTKKQSKDIAGKVALVRKNKNQIIDLFWFNL
jgi:all-trans-retinol dehydrogenase (NAD+)